MPYYATIARSQLSKWSDYFLQRHVILLFGCAVMLAFPFVNTQAQQQKFKSFPARTCGVKCGTERWIVKALADMDAGNVDFTPEAATIDQVRMFVRPASLPIDGRSEPVELKTFKIDGFLTGYKLEEEDHDFHLVIAETSTSKKTFIAEIPDPSCSRVCQSKQIGKIKAVREKFVQKFGAPGRTFKQVNVPVTITGVAFFDFRHGQTGVAPNAFELHPVLEIEFK